MIIECTECGAKYKYPDEKFGDEAAKKVRCTKCKAAFEIQNPKLADEGDRPISRTQKIEMGERKLSGSEAAMRDMLSLPPDKKLSLAVLEGPDSGSIFKIEKPSVTIGRAEADFILNDGEASRQHATIEIKGEKYLIKDLNSTNGTFVEGRKIREADLDNQSEFRIGSSTLMFIVTEDEA